MKNILSNRHLNYAEIALILLTAFIPVFFTYPYRINLFLAWEGSYRMMMGQLPYKDFGTPVGYFFWVIPAFFFKILGPQVFTLIKVQVFINLVSNFTFRAILKNLGLNSIITFLSLLVYCISFSLFNFWPWYNHLVFVLEIIGILCIIKAFNSALSIRYTYLFTFLSALFIALAFLTKQDTGGLGLLICLGMLLYYCFTQKSFKLLFAFLFGYIFCLSLLILPFLPYDFTYWFNYGQFPHNSRVKLFDVLSEFLGASQWIKFYLVIIVILLLAQSNFREYFSKQTNMLFLIMTIGILGQATIIQITSYTPVDGNIYYHSFAFAFILSFYKWKPNHYHMFSIITLSLLVCLWWSGVYWNRFFMAKVSSILGNDEEQVVSKNTYVINQDTLNNNRSDWSIPDLYTFEYIKLPTETIKGINKIQLLDIVKEKEENLKVLNMSELTPLSFEMGFELEKGENIPLWYHKGVSFFDREVNLYCGKINHSEYDLILFEDIPDLNQFYPYEVRDCIKTNPDYEFAFRFLAPRIPEISYIEVYIKSSNYNF